MEYAVIEAESYDICFEHIEELIHKQEPLVAVLRLLISLSVTNMGLPKKHFDYLRRELLHSYGFELMATLNNLEKAGLFKKNQEVTGRQSSVLCSLWLKILTPPIAMNHGEMDDFIAVNMILSGIPLEEPYLQHNLRMWMNAEKSGLRGGKLPIFESYYLMGTVDPTGHLKSGEVCVILNAAVVVELCVAAERLFLNGCY